MAYLTTALDARPLLLLLVREPFPARQCGRAGVSGGMVREVALVAVVAADSAGGAPQTAQ